MRVALVTTEMTEAELDRWALVLQGFKPDDVYLIGGAWVRDVLKPFKNAHDVPHAADLPGSLVVMTPADGRYVEAEDDLELFSHPADATYLFGADNVHLVQSVFGGREPDHVVGICLPGAQQMRGEVAAAITLYDRRVKGNG